MAKEDFRGDPCFVEMIEYDGEMVPKDLCTVDRLGGADDFVGCGNCFMGTGAEEGPPDCEQCVINMLFQHYAEITGQKRGDSS